MCIADIAISRRCYTRVTAITPATHTEVKADPDRLAIGVPSNPNAAYIAGIAATLEQAQNSKYLVCQGTNPIPADSYAIYADLMMTYQTHPAFIHGSLVVFVTGVVASYYEVIMQDDLANELRQYLKEQRTAFTRRG